MVNRINGFSGMDIDSMVKSMMTAKRVPLDKLNQQKQVLQWTRDSYREMNSKLYDFRNNKLIGKYGMSSALNAQTAITSGNMEAVKAEATANANGVDMKVSVTQLATKTSLETYGVSSPLESTKTLGDLQAQLGGTAPVDGYNLTINDVKFVDSNNKPLFTSTTPIATVISTINAKTEAKVVAKYDETTGKLIISSKISGPEGEVKLGTGTTDKELLTLFNTNKPSTGPELIQSTGVKAVVFINGTKMEKDSNVFTVNGVQLTLLKATTTTTGDSIVPTSANDNPVSITTQADATKALETIKGFVEDYNTLIKTMNSRINEAKYRDFAPLTEAQKAEMKEKEIDTWTEKAKSGLLRNDDILVSTLASMRETITQNLGALSTLGITTGTYSEGGRLVLDEAKMKQALTDNPQRVIDLFQGPAGASNDGIFDKLSDRIYESLGKISERAGTNRFSGELTSAFKEESFMGKKLQDYNKRIYNLQTSLDKAESRYYKQFAAMETAMSKLQSQSSSLFGATTS